MIARNPQGRAIHYGKQSIFRPTRLECSWCLIHSRYDRILFYFSFLPLSSLPAHVLPQTYFCKFYELNLASFRICILLQTSTYPFPAYIELRIMCLFPGTLHVLIACHCGLGPWAFSLFGNQEGDPNIKRVESIKPSTNLSMIYKAIFSLLLFIHYWNSNNFSSDTCMVAYSSDCIQYLY